MFFLGFQLDTKKNLFIGLKKISGFGIKINKSLINSIGLIFFCFPKDCRKIHILKLQKLIFLLKLVYGIENLKQKIFDSRERLRTIKHRRAIRFFQRLPVRGQRTKTNAQTVRKFNPLFN